MLEVNIRPGWKKGTTVTFESEGDEQPGSLPPDIQFVIGEKEHPTFTREGNNLIHAARVSLADALGGGSVSLKTLDGRTLDIPFTEVVSPGYVKVVKGEGMPISKTPGARGDLHIKFQVSFPSHLSEEKKRQLKAILKS